MKTHSIRTRFIAVTVSAVIITMVIVTTLGIIAIRNLGMSGAEQSMLLLCEAGQKTIDSYLSDVEQNVDMVSVYVEANLRGIGDHQLKEHVDFVDDFFKKIISHTGGVMTYYYRIDPTVSSKVKGFWFVKDESGGFVEHEVTDITLYDTSDTSSLVWFTIPKASGKPVWLQPYITDNLDERVISYNTPVYFNGQFVGVIGIELDYSFLKELVNNITLYDNGYAFINDSEGKLIYHPHMDVLSLDTLPSIPDGIAGEDNQLVRYRYDGVNKLSVRRILVNGDFLNVSVPVMEVSKSWQLWADVIVIIFVILVVVLTIFIRRYTERITKPLMELTRVAEQIDQGNYDNKLEYNGNDEIGILTRTFSRVTSNLKKYITDLNDLAYADALTSLHNKGAFDIFISNIQSRIDNPEDSLEFAVCIFDCNKLKKVNDQNGHDKGDIYLKETASVICNVFGHSPVFRIGGDEFAAILIDDDYRNREKLLKQFDESCTEKRNTETAVWEKVDVARGIAVYDPKEDGSVNDVVRRADKNMYEDKWTTRNA